MPHTQYLISMWGGAVSLPPLEYKLHSLLAENLCLIYPLGSQHGEGCVVTITILQVKQLRL